MNAPLRLAWIRCASLLSTLATAACLGACGSSGIPDGFTSGCEGAAKTLKLTKGFRLAQEVDYLGFRTESTTPEVLNEPTVSGERRVARWSATSGDDQRGVPCSGATDKAACSAKIASLRLLGDSCEGVRIVTKDAVSEAPQREPGQCSLTYLVYTRGDEVGVVRSADQARKLFGTIDSASEALYLATLACETVTCGDVRGISSYAAVADGFDLASGCYRVVHVSSDGTIQVVKDNGC